MPRFVLAFCVACHILFLQKDECDGWYHQLGLLFATCMAAKRVVLDVNHGLEMEDRSWLSMLLSFHFACLAANNDQCILSFGPEWSSVAGAALFAAMDAGLWLPTTPCTTLHLDAAF